MIGQTISHYRVLEKIGEGGMGEVYLAEDTSLDRKVALKFLPDYLQADEVAQKRFLREAKSAAALDHPYICHIHEIGEVEGKSFIAMEYVKGQTLREKLLEGPVPLKQTLQIGMEIAEALEEAHKAGIVHRDLKPANIMLTSGGHVKVMDFGLAKKVVDEDGTEQDITSALTREGTTLGTIAYMSPEQLRGKPVDTRTDIFSFGIVLYELLSGVHPFRKPKQVETTDAILREDPAPLSRYTEDTADLLQHTVEKMLEKDPSERYQTVHEVRSNLKKLSEKLGAKTVSVERIKRTGLWWKVAIAFSAIAVVVLWIGGAFSPFLPNDGPRQQPTGNLTAHDYYLQGVEYYSRNTHKDSEHAIQLYKRALEEDPDFALAHAGLARTYVQQVKHFGAPLAVLDVAMQEALEARQLDPNLAEGYSALISVYMMKGWHKMMLETAYSRAEAESDESWSGGAWIYLALNEFDKAFSTAIKSVKLNPTEPDSYWTLGYVYLGLADYEKAEHWTRRALEIRPDDYGANLLLGLVLLGRGETDKAEGRIPVLQDLDPKNGQTIGFAADLALVRGDYRKARDLYRQTVQAWPRFENPLSFSTLLGYALLKLGDEVGAEEMFARSRETAQGMLERRDESYKPRLDLAALSAIQGSNEEAYRWIRGAIEAGWLWPDLVLISPVWDGLREQTRFQEMLTEIEDKRNEMRRRVRHMEQQLE